MPVAEKCPPLRAALLYAVHAAIRRPRHIEPVTVLATRVKVMPTDDI
jgi:hypothetical protein